MKRLSKVQMFLIVLLAMSGILFKLQEWPGATFMLTLAAIGAIINTGSLLYLIKK